MSRSNSHPLQRLCNSCNIEQMRDWILRRCSKDQCGRTVLIERFLNQAFP